MNDRLLRRKDVMALVNISERALYRAVSLGAFPKQIRITGGAVRWSEREVMDWIESRKQARTA